MSKGVSSLNLVTVSGKALYISVGQYKSSQVFSRTAQAALALTSADIPADSNRR